ncbi:hypothetical protein ACHWQZ_G014917 [Mnemiopsis leidyi]
MDKLRSRKCPNCDDVGHSSLDCPKLGNGKSGELPEFGSDVGIKLRVSNRGHPQSRLSNPDSRVRSPAHSRLSRPAKIKVSKLLERNEPSRRTDSYLRGEGKFDERPVYPNIAIKTKRTRLVVSDSESDGRGNYSDLDEPLTIQVDYGKPKKSKRRSSDQGISRSLNIQKTITKPGDLRFQMKSRPLAAPLIPQYKTKEDLRFSIKRPTTESKRKKTRPPEHENIPLSPVHNVEEEEELLKEVSGIKRTTTGSVIRFDSSGEEEGGEEEEEVEEEEVEEREEVPIKEKSDSESESESASVKEMEVEEVKPEPKEEPMSAEEEKEESGSSSSSDEDGSSSSSGSDSGSESEEEVVQKKKFIDIREKYDSKPIPASNPAPAKVAPKRQTSRRSSEKNKTEVKRDHHTASDDSGASEVKKPVQKRVKTDTRSSHEGRESRDGPLSKEQLLSLKSNDSDSFSDDGEEMRAHSGALAVLEDTKSRKVSPAPEKIVPIFPFKTKCRANQFPESKVPFIDSHCHIDYLFVRERNFGTFASYVESKDFPKNFSGCVANFCDPPAWGEYQMYEDILTEDGVWGAFGLHPHNAKMWSPEIERDLIRACSHPKCVAWGEMGLDYGKGQMETSPDVIEMQKDAFLAQIKHALKLNKPFVIHARGAEMDAFEIMKAKAPKDHKIHFHCYSGSWNTAWKMLEYFPNMYLGVTGLVTFGTASDVREVARKIPLERLLIETDAPYMKPNNAGSVDQDSPRSASPAMGLWVAAKIAEIRRIELDDVLIQVRKNVTNMYGI